MKEKILRHSITLAGILCFFIYLSSRFLPLMNFMMVEKMDVELQEFTKYGDLYYNNCISLFKGNFPKQIRRYRLSDKNPPLNKADILFPDNPLHVLNGLTAQMFHFFSSFAYWREVRLAFLPLGQHCPRKDL